MMCLIVKLSSNIIVLHSAWSSYTYNLSKAVMVGKIDTFRQERWKTPCYFDC